MKPKIKAKKTLQLALLLALLAGLSCSASQPDKMSPGQFQCDFCKMGIMDMRFKSEAITKKAKLFHFDSVECLVRWMIQEKKSLASAWVTDFYHPDAWVNLRDARFLKSGKLASPMGANLSAYGSVESFERAKNEFGGDGIPAEALEKAVMP